MRSNRFIDVVLVAILVASGAYFATRQGGNQDSPTPVVSATAPAVAAPGFPDKAVPFQLHRVDGTSFNYAGQGPVVITLTAIGCQGCRERIPLDKELARLAEEHKVPLYNGLVFADDKTGSDFAQQYQPQATEILCDPGGRVFVDQYRGSDNNCWMLIGPQGEFLYRGPESMDAMKKALARL